jgi:hypothetical protein
MSIERRRQLREVLRSKKRIRVQQFARGACGDAQLAGDNRWRPNGGQSRSVSGRQLLAPSRLARQTPLTHCPPPIARRNLSSAFGASKPPASAWRSVESFDFATFANAWMVGANARSLARSSTVNASYMPPLPCKPESRLTVAGSHDTQRPASQRCASPRRSQATRADTAPALGRVAGRTHAPFLHQCVVRATLAVSLRLNRSRLSDP